MLNEKCYIAVKSVELKNPGKTDWTEIYIKIQSPDGIEHNK